MVLNPIFLGGFWFFTLSFGGGGWWFEPSETNFI